jgi:hypothetical protein
MKDEEIALLERIDSDVVNFQGSKWVWVSDDLPVDEPTMEVLVDKGFIRIHGSEDWKIAQITWDGRQALKAKIP